MDQKRYLGKCVCVNSALIFKENKWSDKYSHVRFVLTMTSNLE